MNFDAPRALNKDHRLDLFTCGTPLLDEWLRRRALSNQLSGATRTFAAADAENVIAYYALAAGAVDGAAAPGRFRRNMPDPIPIVVLARLAVDRDFQGQGLGRALVADCVQRIDQAAESIGIRGILVHAISEEARAFSCAVGFDPSPLQPMTLMATLADIRGGLM